MSSLYTVEQVAEVLDLHVKTVRRYLREGRLKGRRIGKEYRVARADLEAFAGGAALLDRPAATPRTRRVTASTVVDVDVISPEESHRITTMVMAALNSRRGEGEPLRADSIYYPETATLRITIASDLEQTQQLLRMIDKLLEDGRGRHL